MKKDVPIFKYDDSINELLELSYAFQKSRVLITASELGIFDILGEDYKTAEEVAKEAQSDPSATERLMNAIVALKLLDKRDGKFANTKTSWNCLVKGNQHYFGSLSNFGRMWNKWTTLTDAVIQGTALDPDLPSNRTFEQNEDYLAALYWRGSQQAPYVLNLIDIKKSQRVLDLGGASGSYAMEFIRKYPNLDVTVFDLPEIIEHTQRYIEVKGFEGKINTISGNVLTDKLPKNHYDIVFTSNLLHHFSFWENMEILKNIYDSLRLGGRVIIHEMLLNDSRTGPEFTTLFSLNMLVNTKSGNVMTESELWIMLKEAWFTKFESKETDFGSSLIIGTK